MWSEAAGMSVVASISSGSDMHQNKNVRCGDQGMSFLRRFIVFIPEWWRMEETETATSSLHDVFAFPFASTVPILEIYCRCGRWNTTAADGCFIGAQSTAARRVLPAEQMMETEEKRRAAVGGASNNRRRSKILQHCVETGRKRVSCLIYIDPTSRCSFTPASLPQSIQLPHAAAPEDHSQAAWPPAAARGALPFQLFTIKASSLSNVTFHWVA